MTDTAPGPSESTPWRPGVDALLADGRVMNIRPFAIADRDRLLGLFEDAPPEDLYNRFLGVGLRSARRYVDHICAGEPGVVALIGEVGGRLVAAATAEPVAADSAEISFFVAADLAGCGAATLLLEQLVSVARESGVTRFTALVNVSNTRMRHVLRDAGFESTEIHDGDTVKVEMSTRATDRAQDAADARECAAEARSLAALRDPRVVAVAGVRRGGTGIGHAILDSICKAEFGGKLAVLHPEASLINGIPAYPSLASMPDKVDLLIAAVPAHDVPALVEDAGRAGVACTVVISADFAEAGEQGRAMQHQMVAIARGWGMRIVGPNCFGVARMSPATRLNATFGQVAPLEGPVAVGSQSGGVGIAILDAAAKVGLGVGTFVSLGNKSDVSGNDLLAAWLDDDAVSVGALYLESFGNPRKFARLARRFSQRKPLLAIVGGKSAAGKRAGSSHTAAAASPAASVKALFRQSGVIEVADIDDLVSTAAVLGASSPPAGPRVGVVGNAGGLGVLAADAAPEVGLVAPALSEELRSQLAVAGVLAGTSNPIDLGAAATADRFAKAVGLIARSGEIDSLVVVFAATKVAAAAEVAEAVRDAAAGLQIPVVFVPFGSTESLVDDVAPVPVVASVQGALKAVGHAFAYGQWRRTSLEHASTTQLDWQRVREVAAEVTAVGAAGGWVPADAAADFLRAAGLGINIGVVARGAEDAVAAAQSIGYPVAIKVADADAGHKSERGLVRLGISDDRQVAEAIAAFEAGLERSSPRVLVQPMVTGGVEVAVGVARDPRFGPVVMIASGGTAIDVWDDRVFLSPPVTESEVAAALGTLRVRRLLDGYRGAPPADADALVRFVCGLSEVAENVPELAELDLNPVFVGPDGLRFVDVRIRLTADRPNEATTDRLLSPA